MVAIAIAAGAGANQPGEAVFVVGIAERALERA
jgi:hypothetical protein